MDTKGNQTMTFTGIDGSAGSAIPFSLPLDRQDPAAALARWVLHLPGQHPFWSYYLLSVVHLRDLPGFAPAYKRSPDMEHEVTLFALDPAVTPDPDNPATIKVLTPVNYVEQFAGLTDEQARLLGAQLALAFIAGQLLAEPSGISGARELFSKRLAHEIEDLRHVQPGA